MTMSLHLVNTSNWSSEQVAIELDNSQYVIDPGYGHLLPLTAGQEYNIKVTALKGKKPEPVYSKDGRRVYPSLSVQWCDEDGNVVSPVNIAE